MLSRRPKDVVLIQTAPFDSAVGPKSPMENMRDNQREMRGKGNSQCKQVQTRPRLQTDCTSRPRTGRKRSRKGSGDAADGRPPAKKSKPTDDDLAEILEVANAFGTGPFEYWIERLEDRWNKRQIQSDPSCLPPANELRGQTHCRRPFPASI